MWVGILVLFLMVFFIWILIDVASEDDDVTDDLYRRRLTSLISEYILNAEMNRFLRPV
jgi:hypothetical protein